jgi:hypothetical protein
MPDVVAPTDIRQGFARLSPRQGFLDLMQRWLWLASEQGQQRRADHRRLGLAAILSVFAFILVMAVSAPIGR